MVLVKETPCQKKSRQRIWRKQQKEYSERVSGGHNYRDLTCGFIAGAKWQRDRLTDDEYSFSGKFSGLCPAWINAPSTLQPAHKYHGRNVVAIHEKTGGFRCCCIDDEVPSTFHVPENTELVPGWTGRKSKKDDA